MGGVLPLTIRIYAARARVASAATSAPPTRSTRSARSSARSPPASSCCPSLGLQRGLGIGAVLTVGAGVDAARRRAPERAGALVAAALAARRGAGAIARAAALEPAPLLGRPVPRLDRQGHHRVEQVGAARARATTTTASPPPSRVERWGKTVALKNNGKVDASNGDDMATQIMVGLMPLRLPPDRARATRRASRSSASAPASPSARSRSSPSATPTSSSSSPRWSTPARASSARATTTPKPTRACTSIIGDGRNFLTQAVGQVRRHRLRAVEPVDHRRLEPVHRRLLEAGARAPRRRRRLLPVGAALRDVVDEHQDHPAHRSPRSSPTPTSSRPRISRRTSSWSPPTIRWRSTSARLRATSTTRRCAAELKRGGVESAEDRDLLSAAHARRDPRLHRRLAAQHRRQRAHRVRRAARSPRLDAHRRSLPGARLRHRVALRPLRSLPRRARRGPSSATSGRPSCAWRARCSRTASAPPPSASSRAAKRHGAPAGLARRAAGRAPRRAADRRSRGAASAVDAEQDDPIGLSALDPPKLPEQRAAPTTSTSSAASARAPGRTRSSPCASWPEKWIDEGGPDLELAARLPLVQGRARGRRRRSPEAAHRRRRATSSAARRCSTTWRAPSTATACSSRPCATWRSTSTLRTAPPRAP